MGLGGKDRGILGKKLSDAFIEKASHLIDNETTCKQHRGQPLVAFVEDQEAFGCQQCIYEGEDTEDAVFVTLKAREIHDTFKENYQGF